MHPAYDGLASLPYYDEFDLSTVDILLISQYVTNRSFPWDYCASHDKGGAHRLADYKWPLLSGFQQWNIVPHMVEVYCFKLHLRQATCQQKSSCHVHRQNQYHHDRNPCAQVAVFVVT